MAFTLPEGVTAVDGNATVKTDAAGVASLNVVSTKVGKYTVKAALGDKSIGEGVAIEFTKVAATPTSPASRTSRISPATTSLARTTTRTMIRMAHRTLR